MTSLCTICELKSRIWDGYTNLGLL